MTTLTKGIMVATGASIAGMFIYMTTFFNASSVDEAKAEVHARSMMGYEINDGDVIASFNWDEKIPGKATVGPDAIDVSKTAVVTPDGSGETSGLGAGKEKNEINLQIPADKEFNTEGIDISFDFKRMEKTCDFYSRGNYFNFGMKKGKIVISYKVTLGNNKTERVDETTRYEIPTDNDFRNYRFTYDPQNGKGEIFVNKVTVWSHDGPEEAPLYWKTWDNVIIGRGMIGNGEDKALLDNFVVKSTTHVSKMPIHLLDFEALNKENHVMIRWFTIKEVDVDSFRVERSLNGTDFEPIGCVKASGNSTTLQAYALADMHPVEGASAFYRLVPSNKPLKSITVPIIGYKYRKDHIENMTPEQAEAKIKNESIENGTKK
ncbi:MAG TPA: hypothetical protein VJY62_16365 [Bacteroidia bacterium]|nr:hypothetical protein [Bacteroidia bacterium]